MTTPLCPVQQRMFDYLVGVLPLLPVIGVTGSSGSGKTIVLRKIHEKTGGQWLSARELLLAMRTSHPLALEETFAKLVGAALDQSDHVYLDDLHLLTNVVSGGCGTYPRTNFLAGALESLTAQAELAGKKLLFAAEYAPRELQKKGYVGFISPFEAADYEFFCKVYLGLEQTAKLDFRKIYRFAGHLNGYDLKTVGILFRADPALDTERYIDALRNFGLTSNVNLGEVQQVALADLKGVDDVIESLEANVIIPLEQYELSEKLRLRPKRGVLLVGPPGTGKTTVGRALAHRLKSKFFLIDGTCISGTNNFYHRILQVFHEAKHNAPSIVFLDDSDAIFESGEELGLYRYLLTMLDGLESESVGQVCVMLTAMDVGHLPPALIRSGRIELWLEMRLPDHGARSAILGQMFSSQARELAGIDLPPLVAATEGFTGADLKRLVDDGKNLLAHDIVRALPLQPVTEYFLRAVETVRDNKQRYADAESRARSLRPSRPVYYDAAAVNT